MDGKHRIPGAVAEEVGRQEGGLYKENKRKEKREPGRGESDVREVFA